MRTKTEAFQFYGQVRHETVRAYRVFDGIHTVWLPKSQVLRSRRIGSVSDDLEFVIPYWLARKKGII